MKRSAVKPTANTAVITPVITMVHRLDEPLPCVVVVLAGVVFTLVVLVEAPTVVKLPVTQALVRLIALERTRQ
jgi:hypothetical protein